MRQDNVAPAGIDIAGGQRRTQGLAVAVPNFLVGEEAAHITGLQKRQQPEGSVAVLVLQHHALDPTRVHRRKRNPLMSQKLLRVGDALGRVVVARHGQHAHPRVNNAREEIIEQRHGLSRRRSLVIDVAGDEQRRNLLLDGNAQYLAQNMPLIFQHGNAVDALAHVQIGHVQNPHAPIPYFSALSSETISFKLAAIPASPCRSLGIMSLVACPFAMALSAS